ncbi:oxalate oxidase 1-like [Aegilops tauschii subsp. strangulata]|uniref:oxalate oxidase 1-like n=1 Tax=Aegilops tauschii subsp. strangulata TaxID=200361 RepID=UPI00098A533D|nr:oxalate oxidase 1-like [Aegilops tauschii subsp. strangulata]
MGCSKLIAGMLTMLLLAPAVHATDPDPLQDFCVVDLDGKAVSMNGHPCKPMSEAGDDFLFLSKLPKAGNTSTPNGSDMTELDVAEWPGMNTLDVSMNRVDFPPGGTNPPHIHPRATEIGIVVGVLGTGLLGSLDSGNKLYSRVVRAGETFLIPRGLMHFQFNIGKTEASMVVSFNSQNPGIVFVPLTLFGSNPPIPTPVLTKALRVEAGVVELLKSKFVGGS